MTGEMTQRVKVLATQVCSCEFNPRNPHEGVQKELVPYYSSDLHKPSVTCMPTYKHYTHIHMHTHMHTTIIIKLKVFLYQ